MIRDLRRPLRPRRVPWAAALVVVVTLLVTAAELSLARQWSNLDAERRAASSVANAGVAVSELLDTSLIDARAGTTPATTYAGVADAVAAGVSESAVIRARDAGVAVLDDVEGGAVVAATYGTSTVPATVAERRRHLSGLRVIELDLAGTLELLRPTDGGLVLSGPRRAVQISPATVGPGDAAATVHLAPSSDWTLLAWTTPHPPGWLRLLVAGTLLAGAAAAWATDRRDARARRTREELRRVRVASAEVSTLTRMAQQSLDLAEVLPAVTAHLSDTLGLRGLSLGASTPNGERRFFVWGESPPDTPPPGPVPLTARAGAPVALSLSRGGRAVAALRLVPGRDLDQEDLAVLGAAGEALSSALANAESLAQQREQVARMRSIDELKTVFLATASHELRTPVAAISGFTEILTAGWDRLPPESARRYVDRIHTSARHLNGLVEDLLDFSRIENRRGVLDGAVLDLGNEVGRILAEHRELTSDHVLTSDLAAGLTVQGSPHALERIVTNLVGNAAKYSPAGGAIRVRVWAAAPGEAQLVVEDEGPGIPADEREKVFSRFFRGDSESVTHTRGAGLGLAIVREFTAALGGRVRVSDAPGGGAAFEVSFPVCRPEEAVAASATTPGHAPDHALGHDAAHAPAASSMPAPAPAQSQGATDEQA